MASALRNSAEFFIEYFAIDLIMDEEGACRGVVAMCMEDGSIHRFRAQKTILATGGYGRAYFSCTSAHTCTGDGNAMVLRAGLPLQDMEFVQFHPTGIYGAGCLITEGIARRRRLSDQLRRRALHGALCAKREGPRLARRCLPRDDHGNPRRVAASARTATTSSCTSTISTRSSGTSACRAFLNPPAFLPASTSPRSRSRCCRRSLQYGRHPDQLSRRSADQEVGGDADHVVPGLMAIGEAACVSVHGANRLGSNSLIDLVVFGRAAGLRCGETRSRPVRSSRSCRKARREALARLDKFRYADGDTPTANLRLEMQRSCRTTARCSAPARCSMKASS
jgi:succinate dehydrogenase/fumarate reductase flavoprotein subunit